MRRRQPTMPSGVGSKRVRTQSAPRGRVGLDPNDQFGKNIRKFNGRGDRI
jgi:hypothetical protein